MTTPLANPDLDAILALQISVAWAGEGRSEPPRLGWWPTDLVDEAGGGDLLRRLLPQTHAWASLVAVREAARRVDDRARRAMTDSDRVRTIFHLGFEIDERLDERLAQHRRELRAPHEVLPGLLAFDVFDRARLEAHLALPDGAAVDHRVVPGGREVIGPIPAAPDALVRRLAAALVPLSDQYPCPFYRTPS
jgi:hypothetical protein